MKKTITLALITVLIAFGGNAQQTTAPGVPTEQLHHVYMPSFYIDLNGEKIEGEIKFTELNTNYIWYRLDNQSKDVKLFANQVKSFNYNSGLNFYSLKSNFYKRVNKETKIVIYKKFVKDRGPSGSVVAAGETPGSYKYSIIIKDALALKAVDDLSFMPFHKKVSVLIKDCPELSTKVAKKEKGYKKNLITPKYIRWERTATEYENCK